MAKDIQEAQTQDQDLKALLQLMLEDRANERAAKKKEEDEARSRALENINLQIASAKEENEMKKLRREQCDGLGGPPHQTLNPATMQTRSAWRAQVNSDGTFSPVCCKCQLVMPKIKATLEQEKNGVGLHAYVQLTPKALENWHAQSYPEGCDFEMCHVCHPKKYPNKDCKNDACHFCHANEPVAV